MVEEEELAIYKIDTIDVETTPSKVSVFYEDHKKITNSSSLLFDISDNFFEGVSIIEKPTFHTATYRISLISVRGHQLLVTEATQFCVTAGSTLI